MKDASRHLTPAQADNRSALESFVRALARAAARDAVTCGTAMNGNDAGQPSVTAGEGTQNDE
jgi:hypothetical protein